MITHHISLIFATWINERQNLLLSFIKLLGSHHRHCEMEMVIDITGCYVAVLFNGDLLVL
jgi:hypothetical protein